MSFLAPDRPCGTLARWLCTIVATVVIIAQCATLKSTHIYRFNQDQSIQIGFDGIAYDFHDRSTWTRTLPEGYRLYKHDLTDIDDGIFLSDGNNWPGDQQWFVRIPWFYMIVLFGAPAITLWIWRARFQRPGVCQHCGYNLTGQRANRRRRIVCPECGTTQQRTARTTTAASQSD